MAKFDSFYEALNKTRKKAGLESTEELAKKAAPRPQDTTLKDLGKIFQNLWSGTKNSIRGTKITSADSDMQLSKFAYKDQLNALNDAAKSPWAKTWNRDNLNVWSGMHGGVYQARRDKESTAKNNLYALSKRIEEEQKNLQELNKDSSPLVRVISDMAYSAGNMAPALPFGPAGMILQGASNYGTNLADELNAGTGIKEARKRAGTRAAVETGVEYISGGLAGTASRSGVMKPVAKLIDSTMPNGFTRKALTRIASSAGEGAEEALTTAIMPYIDRTYLGVDTPNASVGDLAKSFGLGAGTSLAIGGGQDAMNALRNRRAVNNISDKTSLSNEEVRNTIDTLSEVEPYQVAKQLKKQGAGENVVTPKQGNNLLMKAIYGDDIPQQKINGLPDLEVQIQENRANIANQKPIKIRGERFKMGTGTLKTDVEQLFREHGNMAHNDVLGDVALNTRGIKDSIGHGMSKEKAALYEAVPSLIQNGKIVDYVKNHKGRGYNSVVLEAPVTITKGDAKGDYIAEVVVHRIAGDKRQRYYLHDVTIKKIKDGIYNKQTQQGGTVEQPRSLPDKQVNPSSIDYNIQQDEKYVNSVPQNNDRSIDQLLGERLQLPMASSDDASSTYNMLQDGNYVNSGDVPIKQKKTDSEQASPTIGAVGTNHGAMPDEQVYPSSIDYNVQQDKNYVNDGVAMGARRTTKRILNDESSLVFDDPQMQSEFYDEINNAKNVYYEKVSTKEATEKALSEIEQQGIEGAANLFYKNLGTSKRGKERAENLILGVELAKAYTNAGDVDGASNIISEIMPITTDAAQVMSLTKALYKLGGRGVLKSIQSDLARINKQRGTEIEIDEILANRLAGAKTEPEIQAAAQAIEADLKQRIPVKLHEKLGALRRISMLANPKTQVRNLVGNAAMNLMGRMSSAIDGMLQRMLIRDPNLRTNTIFKRRSPEYSNARTFAKEYFKTNKEAVSGDSRYDSRTARLLRDRDTFKNKAMRFVEQKTNRVMEWGDEIFTGNAFQRHFANEVVARKLSMEDLKNPANRQQLEQVINHAALKAQKETFRDESRLANSITSLKNRLNNSKNPLAKAAGAWIDGVIPFTKTPINVTKRAIDYSPLGIIKTVYQGIESRGTPMAKANFINSLSQNLTGTVMAGLGYTLAQSGLIRVGGDDKEEYYESDQGRQRYSLEIGDTSISLDWLSPAAMPFFMGAVWSETDGADSIDDVFAAGQQIFGPLMEMSMMSSADDMITNIRKADTNIEAIAEALIYTPFESYLLQYLPTTGSQLNQVIDPTRRTTYTNADSEVLGRLEKTGRKALNKLPGANLLLENMGLKDVANAPYVNAWGEKQVNDGNVLERVFNSFINPAYVNEIKSDEVDREIERLYNSNVEDSKYIIPTTSFGTVTNGGNEYKMTTTEVTKHRQTQGRMSKQILRSLINNSAYRSASDEDKIKMIKDVYKYAEYRADTGMLEGRGKTYNIKESDWRKKVDYLDASGIPPTTYFLAHNARSNAEGQYTLNEWGEREAVKGSAKKAQVNAINGYGMTAAQKLLFLYLETPSYSYGKEYSGMSNDQARRVVANYVIGLNIPQEEKIKILKRAGYHIKDGYAYWD